MNIFKVIVVSLLMVLLSSCDNNKSGRVSPFSFENTDFQSLQDSLNDLEQAESFEQILQSSTPNQKASIKSALRRARSGLKILAQTGEVTIQDKNNAYDSFENSIRQYERFGIIENEQFRFDEAFNKVRQLKFQLSEELDRKDDDRWTLFNHNFSTFGLEPNFTTIGFSSKGKPKDEAKWFTNFQTDLPKARVQGRAGDNGWLISRPFDLKEIKEPSFRYFGSLLVVAPNNVVPLAQVITDVFKTYVILDYKPGENPDEIGEDRKKLITYDLDTLPLGRDFHDTWVPSKSLEEYKGHEVSVAFLFDTRGINYTQYYSWTIFDFELNGAGELKEDLVKYKYQFSDATLGLYKDYSLEFPGANWKASNGFASVRSTPEDVDTFLLSPKLDIPNELLSPNLVIKETFVRKEFNLEQLENMEILISKNFIGGMSPLSTGVEWDRIDHNLLEIKPPDEGEEENAKLLHHQVVVDLNKYSGEEIVIAFRFKSKSGSKYAWGIDSLQINGEKAEVTEIDYILDNPSTKFTLANHDLVKAATRDFKIEETVSSVIIDGVEVPEIAPKWKKDSRGAGFQVSGFGGRNDDGSFNPAATGETRVIFPKVSLSSLSDARVRLLQKFYHNKNAEITPEVVKLQIREISVDGTQSKWSNIEIPATAFKENMKSPLLTPWLKIPEAYLGKEIEVSLRYKAQDKSGGTLEWTISSIEIGGK